jgi:glutathione S-transferase
MHEPCAGEVKLTQSQTILRYLARKYGAGKGVYEGSAEYLARIDLIMDQVWHIQTGPCVERGDIDVRRPLTCGKM